MAINRELFNMNLSWRFHDGDIHAHNINTVHDHFTRPEYVKAGNNGLAYTSYDDKAWPLVNLPPHDFVVERNTYDTDTPPSCTGSFEKGIVWYRKTFDIPVEDRGRRLFIQFDGVYRDCEVWLNGNLVGRHVGGYMGFELEVTELMHYGHVNSFAIKVDATEYEGWWYEGGGIYRDVRLLKTGQVRIKDDEVQVIVNDINLQKKTASVTLEGIIDFAYMNQSNEGYHVSVDIINPAGDIVDSKTLELDGQAHRQTCFSTEFELSNVDLWDLANRHLYLATVKVESNMNIDTYSTNFGIRTIEFTSHKGFELNGQTVKLKGVCGHDDFAGVGVALTKPIIKHKIDCLMAMGVNAYRCAHNPPDPKFLQLCDEVGMLVIDETRLSGVNSDDLGDYVAMIKRDRNHPCIISWSMGNEEMAIHATEIGVQIFKKMTAIGQLYDTSRPFLYAINADYDRIVKFDRDHGLVQNPVGLNYFVPPHDDDIYATMHKDYPDLCMLNTETTGICSTREFALPYDDRSLMSPNVDQITVWEDKTYESKVTCYGNCRPVWGGMSPETSWKVHADRVYSAGVFLWTGFDYRGGEVFPYDYPATITFFGIIDLCGIPKDWFYYMKAQWTDEVVLHLLPHWNMNIPEGTSVDVWAFTNCDQVELFLNGVSQGKKACVQYGHIEWPVTYEQGTIEAIGYKDGLEIIKDKKK